MSTPRYVVKCVGGDYVAVRVDASEVATRLGLVAAGLSMAAWGLQRRGLRAGLALVTGSAIAWRGVTGYSILDLLSKKRAPNGDPKDAPSYLHHGRKSGQLPADPIDEASMESFPASDPPSSLRSNSTAPEQG